MLDLAGRLVRNRIRVDALKLQGIYVTELVSGENPYALGDRNE